MNKNQKPSMSKRRATVAAVLCFVAAIAIAGTYTFNDYRKTQKNELAKAEEKARQQIPGQPELQDQKEPEHPDHQVRPEPRQRQEKVTISTLRKTVTSCGR